MVPPFRRRGASVRWRINLLLPPHRRWRDGKNLRKVPPFDSVGGPGGLDDTVAVSTMQGSSGRLPLFNLVGRPEGLDDTVVLSITQEGMKSFGDIGADSNGLSRPSCKIFVRNSFSIGELQIQHHAFSL